MAKQTHRYILQWSRMITPHIKHLCLVREDQVVLPFTAGQFITLHFEDTNNPGKIIHRSYSIANIPQQDNTIEIACAYVENGRASKLLFDLQPGEGVDATGPYGLFILKDEKPKRYVLVATGTGIAPYRSMLAEIQKRLEEHNDLSIVVLLGVKDRDELLFGDNFIECANKCPNFHFKACFSRAKPEGIIEPYASHGHVQDQFSELALNPESDIVYLCGNPFMIDDAFALLTAQGFDRKAIRREKYLFAH